MRHLIAHRNVYRAKPLPVGASTPHPASFTTSVLASQCYYRLVSMEYKTARAGCSPKLSSLVGKSAILRRVCGGSLWYGLGGFGNGLARSTCADSECARWRRGLACCQIDCMLLALTSRRKKKCYHGTYACAVP